MKIYGEFAAIYDDLIGESPLVRANFVKKVWKRRKLNPRLVLDLACGTGSVTEILAEDKIEMIGADVSPEMLAVAKNRDSENNILYLCQDMREFELYGTVDSIICLCDSLNYLLKLEEVKKVFSLAHNYLNVGGLFVFDVNTRFMFENVLGGDTFAQTGKKSAYIWENSFDDVSGINEYFVTFFVEENSGLYKRFEEVHQERAYSEEELRDALQNVGFDDIETFDGYSLNPAKNQSERVVFVAKRV